MYEYMIIQIHLLTWLGRPLSAAVMLMGVDVNHNSTPSALMCSQHALTALARPLFVDPRS